MRAFAIFLGACLCAACAPKKEVTRAEPPPAPPVAAAPQKWSEWAALAVQQAPARDQIRDRYRYVRELDVTDVSNFRYLSYRPSDRKEIVGFAMTNRGSEHINPRGLDDKGAMRIFTFLFPDRARENIYLTVNDDVNLTGRFSHDNMYREVHFFPRVQLPTVEVVPDSAKLKVTLPTGEPVLFDARNMEIVGGVLQEEPIDFNRNRYQRRNPGLRYTGQHMIITVEQRGEAPRREKIWGQTKHATVYYPAKYAKPCRISPRHIWDQSPKPGDSDPKLTMLHPNDASLFNTIEKQCGWDMTDLALAAAAGPGMPLRASTGTSQNTFQ